MRHINQTRSLRSPRKAFHLSFPLPPRQTSILRLRLSLLSPGGGDGGSEGGEVVAGGGGREDGSPLVLEQCGDGRWDGLARADLTAPFAHLAHRELVVRMAAHALLRGLEHLSPVGARECE